LTGKADAEHRNELATRLDQNQDDSGADPGRFYARERGRRDPSRPVRRSLPIQAASPAIVPRIFLSSNRRAKRGISRAVPSRVERQE
jgi:hypothetical protein